MLLSTFELLLKPITPSTGTVSNSDRSILQGYFLNVSNPTNRNLRIRLRFNATTPSINPSELLDVLDTSGTNDFSGSLVADGANRFRYDFTLNAGDTGLFILQPNILTLNPASDTVEVRGYVEIFIVVPFFGVPRPLLVTPEHRGTFLPSPNGTGEFDQLITALPTSTGAGMLMVDTISNLVFDGPFTPNPLPIPQPIPLPDPIIQPIQPIAAGNGGQGGAVGNGGQDLSLAQVLNAMAERIDTLEANLTASRNNNLG
jgi:hypothetical protein